MRRLGWLLLAGCADDPDPPATILPPPSQIEVTAAVPGQPVTVTLSGIPDGVRVVAAIAAGTSAACPVRLLGQCSDLDNPSMRRGTTSAGGAASVTMTLPAEVPEGATLYVQVAGTLGQLSRMSPVIPVTAVGAGCTEAQQVVDAHCIGCHGAVTLGDLDLRDLTTIVGVDSATAPMPLVTAGDSAASYLVHKVDGTHVSVGGTGSLMPPGGTIADELRDALRHWVDAGAACPPEPVLPIRPAPAGLRALTPSHYAASLRTVLDLGPADDAPIPRIGAWATSAGAAVGSIHEVTALDYEATARELAAWVLDPVRRDAWTGCTPTTTAGDGCKEAVIADVGRRAFRRPLTTDEQQRWHDLSVDLAVRANDGWYGLEMALSGLLQSPNFLYRVELTEPDPNAPSDQPDRRRYSDYEVATRLSYLLFGDTPDDELLDAVAAGELATDVGLFDHIDRMLGDPRAEQGMDAFLTELLEVDALEDLEKNELLFPDFDGQREALAEQLLWSATAAVLDEGYPALFTTDSWFVDEHTAALYGLDPATFSGPALTQMPPERRGLLTMPGFLAMHAYPGKTSPALRGLYVRNKLLCFNVPPPPPSVVTVLPDPDPGVLVTTRELVASHLTDPTCAGCHGYMDPIGLGLERFDAVGAHRTTENGLTIDPSGELDGQPFADAADLGQAVADHDDLLPCLTANLLSYANGVTVPEDHPEVMGLTEASGDIRAALGLVARSALFRNAWEVTP